MSRRRRRPPIAVTLVLPAEPPTPEEIDGIGQVRGDAVPAPAQQSALPAAPAALFEMLPFEACDGTIGNIAFAREVLLLSADNL